MSKSIYPSIPAPGPDADSMRATLDAIRQTLTMLIINAQSPHANFTPSSAAQIFVTNAQLSKFNAAAASSAGVHAAQAEPQGPTPRLPPPALTLEPWRSELEALKRRVAELERQMERV